MPETSVLTIEKCLLECWKNIQYIFRGKHINLKHTHIFILMHKCTIPVHMISGANVETARPCPQYYNVFAAKKYQKSLMSLKN